MNDDIKKLWTDKWVEHEGLKIITQNNVCDMCKERKSFTYDLSLRMHLCEDCYSEYKDFESDYDL